LGGIQDTGHGTVQLRYAKIHLLGDLFDLKFSKCVVAIN